MIFLPDLYQNTVQLFLPLKCHSLFYSTTYDNEGFRKHKQVPYSTCRLMKSQTLWRFFTSSLFSRQVNLVLKTVYKRLTNTLVVFSKFFQFFTSSGPPDFFTMGFLLQKFSRKFIFFLSDIRQQVEETLIFQFMQLFKISCISKKIPARSVI